MIWKWLTWEGEYPKEGIWIAKFVSFTFYVQEVCRCLSFAILLATLTRPFLLVISQLREKLVNECYSHTLVTPLKEKKKKEKETAARDTWQSLGHYTSGRLIRKINSHVLWCPVWLLNHKSRKTENGKRKMESENGWNARRGETALRRRY